MIDVYAAADLFPAGTDRILASELSGALLRAEGVTTPSSLHLDKAAHRNASFPANNRVAFNIAASKYRLAGGGEVLGTDRVRATRGHDA